MTRLYRLIFERLDSSEFESAQTRESGGISVERILVALDQECYKGWNWRLVEA